MLKLKKRYEKIDKEDLPARFAKLLNKSASSDDPVEFLKAQVSTKQPRKQPVSRMEQAIDGGKVMGLLGGALGGATGGSLESALKGSGAGLLAGSLLGAVSKPSKTRVRLEDKPESKFYQDAWRAYNPDAFDEHEYAQAMEGLYKNKTASVTLREWLRNCIEEELDAISLYEKYAEETDNKEAAALFQEVADDEKHHVADFMELLLKLDKVQDEELEKKAEFLGPEAKTRFNHMLPRGAFGSALGSSVGSLLGMVATEDMDGARVGATLGGGAGLGLGLKSGYDKAERRKEENDLTEDNWGSQLLFNAGIKTPMSSMLGGATGVLANHGILGLLEKQSSALPYAAFGATAGRRLGEATGVEKGGIAGGLLGGTLGSLRGKSIEREKDPTIEGTAVKTALYALVGDVAGQWGSLGTQSILDNLTLGSGR